MEDESRNENKIEVAAIKDGAKKKEKQLRPTLITGGYEQDIQCLMDSEMIDEFLPVNAKFDKIMKAIIKANNDKSVEERLITKM